jgi:Glycosyl hydrolase family 26
VALFQWYIHLAAPSAIRPSIEKILNESVPSLPGHMPAAPATAAVSRPTRFLVLLVATILLISVVKILSMGAVDDALTPSAGTLAADATTDEFDFNVILPGQWASAQPTGGLLDTEPFLLGIYMAHANMAYLPADYWSAEHKLGAKFRIVSLYQPWGPRSLTSFPDALLKQVWQHGAMPMITWEPWTSTFPEFKSDPDLSHDRRVFHAIVQGRLDKYIAAYAQRLRDYHRPIFLRFAHEPDNRGYPWTVTGGNTPDEYVAGWRYVVNIFKSEGASNVTFVWNPWSPEGVRRYFPGAPYFDWFGLTLLNYGGAYHDGKWYSFDELYAPYHREFAKLGIDKPTMLAEFGSTAYGGNRAKWLGEAMDSIATRHPEIRGAVFFHSDCDPNWPTPWRPPGNPRCIDWTFLGDSGAVAMLHPVLTRPHFHEQPARPPLNWARTRRHTY